MVLVTTAIFCLFCLELSSFNLYYDMSMYHSWDRIAKFKEITDLDQLNKVEAIYVDYKEMKRQDWIFLIIKLCFVIVKMLIAKYQLIYMFTQMIIIEY